MEGWAVSYISFHDNDLQSKWVVLKDKKYLTTWKDALKASGYLEDDTFVDSLPDNQQEAKAVAISCDFQFHCMLVE